MDKEMQRALEADGEKLLTLTGQDHGPEFWREGGIMTSEVDEDLMLDNMQHCYGGDTLGFRVSVEHYRYLVEQIVSLRQHVKRII